VADKRLAIVLGKALFWDMQVSSDGIQACASCHFHAGADSREKNQMSPGLRRVHADLTPDPDTTFALGVNATLTPDDFPITNNDVVSSQGVFFSIFEDPTVVPDPDGFRVQGINVRRVEPRHTPSVINAVFNHRNFWDGRAQPEFNGVNHLGARDTQAHVYRAVKPHMLAPVRLLLNNASLASQTVLPIISDFEMSALGRTPAEVGQNLARRKRKHSKKLKALRPLAGQQVHKQDSVLGQYSRAPKPGLTISSYDKLIQAVFRREWWHANSLIAVAPDGTISVVKHAGDDPEVEYYTLLEYNFPLFFGLAVQLYEATLVADDTPFDRWLRGEGEISEAAKKGADIFRSQHRGRCINCHGGPELTEAAVTTVFDPAKGFTRQREGNLLDRGFNNIGVRPTREDPGVGGRDVLGHTLSIAYQTPLPPQVTFGVDGAFKVPGLRNVELTAPYFHNGGYLTLRDVIDFYSRGGDFLPIESFAGTTISPLSVPLFTPEETEQLLAFLLTLTDERVRFRQAPFDHPQLFIPNGHPGNEVQVTDDGTGKATDMFREISAVGAGGSDPLPLFLNVAQD
jgi:cytochrome c peroxidase